MEVFIPLEPINPEEIHPDELMDEAEFDEEQQLNLPENEAQNQQHLNVGFVEFIEPAGDPFFQQYLNRALPLFLPNAEAVRIWANFFSSSGGTNSVTIPRHWADFFTALLSNPTSFMWAKYFLASQAWKAMNQDSLGITFTLPEKFPSIQIPDCSKDLSNQVDAEKTLNSSNLSPLQQKKENDIQDALSPSTPVEQISSNISPSTGPWSKVFLDQAEQAKKESVLKDPHKRRSKRLHNQKRGFKDLQCFKKNCLGCTVEPPTLSPSMIKNLGATF